MLGISNLGWVHTLSSLPAIPAAVVMFARHGRIIPRSLAGRIYFIAMVAGAVTVYPIAHQAVSMIIATVTLAFLLTGYGIDRFSKGSHLGEYAKTISLTLSAFLLALPTLSETLRRLPAGHPIATSLNSPILVRAQGALLVLLVVGLTLQMIRLRRSFREIPA